MLLRFLKVHRFSLVIASTIAAFILLYVYHLNSLHYEVRNIYRTGIRTKHNNVYVDLHELLMGAIQATRSGGYEVTAIARTYDFQVLSKGKTDEGANDPITMADKLSHCAMKVSLERLFPRVAIYSEEDKEQCSNSTKTFEIDEELVKLTSTAPSKWVLASDVTVWLDPLDATQEYTEKLFDYVTTMACVAVKGVPEIGVIHRPFTGETAWVWVGGKLTSSYLDYLHISRQPQGAIENIKITVSRSHAGNAELVVKDVFGPEARILKAAGAGYKALQVVTNNASLYLHTTKIKKWDICAGNAILRNFGGNMVTLKNETIDYGVGSDPVASDGLLAAINNREYFIGKIMQYTHKHKDIVR